MTSRLGFPVFDGDNHMYETRDALTKFLPPEYHGAVRYVEVDGRTKIATLGQISEYIPNPTFDKVAAPGAQEDYFHNGNPEGKSHREILGKAIEATPAMREPEPRLELLDEQGIDKSMTYPTLASLVEERFREHPEATHTIIHALNQWLDETWTFDYKGRIFTTPIITLPIVDRAIDELNWVVERGARAILIRPAPVPDCVARGHSRCPSSTPSGSGLSRPACWSSCTPRTADIPGTPTTGRVPASSGRSSRRRSAPTTPWPATPPRTPWRRWPATGC